MLIRPLTLADVPELTAILNDPEVMKHSIGGVCDETATRGFIQWCMACYEAYGVGPWALIDKEDATLIGFCGVSPEMVAGVEEMNLGYRLAAAYWNKGLATEAAEGVLNYVFTHKLCKSVVVIIEPEHVASLKVAQKAGFSAFEVLEFYGRSVRLYRLNREQTQP
ncbi:GNAT family N-acetyltransferase [Aliidiomarina soli]|uniref:GNAT family N-acetyltransferase n=1 Tax=Aliidiomarina soli TaxID=1928574 RepID=A0A432WLY7_9GAMM|nr:GNAT family N-acetyltransferase [Aliidiomarina soli]RUO34803.1 GNAT family N-acetyltransferase [Aliidiomarina soli]